MQLKSRPLRSTRWILVSSIVCALIGATVPALAQPGPPPPPPPPGGYGPAPGGDGGLARRGVFGGLGLGFGEMTADCEGCGDALESVSFAFDVGYRFNPRLGLVLDGWGLGHPEKTPYGDLTLVHAIVTIGIKYWLSPMLWIKAGVGEAQLSLHFEGEVESESKTEPAAMFAGGYEMLHSPGFSLDLELRAGTGFFEEGSVHNVALALSVNWHQLGHAY
jgi:hypothetical protein